MKNCRYQTPLAVAAHAHGTLPMAAPPFYQTSHGTQLLYLLTLSLATLLVASKKPQGAQCLLKDFWAWGEVRCHFCLKPKTYTNPHSHTACLALGLSTFLGH
jgi:hypothetical protein